MICINCNEFFIVKKTINTLFKEEKYFLCQACYKKYPISIGTNIIPINSKIVNIFSLFDKLHFLNIDAFIVEYSALINYLYSQKTKVFMLLLDKVTVNEELEKTLEIINELFDEEIYIVSFF